MGNLWVHFIPVSLLYYVLYIMGGCIAALVGVQGNMLWRSMMRAKRQLAAVGPKLDIIADNHLKHIQDATQAMSEKQEETNRMLAEQSGYLRAIADNVKK
jgi:hypothetical protein